MAIADFPKIRAFSPLLFCLVFPFLFVFFHYLIYRGGLSYEKNRIIQAAAIRRPALSVSWLRILRGRRLAGRQGSGPPSQYAQGHLSSRSRPASGLLLQCGAGYPHHPGRSLPAYSCRLLPLPRTSAALAAFSALSAGMHRPFRRLPGQASLTCPDFLSYNRVSADSAIPLQEKILRN